MKFQLTLHRKLWNDLADNPEMDKEDWPEWAAREPVDSYCFACDYNWDRFKDSGCDCSGCPLVWPKNNDEETACHTGGLFDQWENSIGQTRANLARTIANLPVREGVEWE